MLLQYPWRHFNTAWTNIDERWHTVRAAALQLQNNCYCLIRLTDSVISSQRPSLPTPLPEPPTRHAPAQTGREQATCFPGTAGGTVRSSPFAERTARATMGSEISAPVYSSEKCLSLLAFVCWLPRFSEAATSRFAQLRMMCQFVNPVDMTVLPPYVPSAAEKGDPALYAANVRALYAEAGSLPLSSHSQSDFLALTKVRPDGLDDKTLNVTSDSHCSIHHRYPTLVSRRQVVATARTWCVSACGSCAPRTTGH